MSDKKIILRGSDNIITDISTPISQRNPLDIIVYFNRYIGFDNENEYIALINSLNEKLSLYSSDYLIFTEKIATDFEKEKTEKHEAVLINANVLSVSVSHILDTIINNAMLILSKNDSLNQTVRQGLATILGLYKTNDTGKNASIFINFIVKMTNWINKYAFVLFERQSDINPKVIYYGSVKKHEAYFLILLSLIGCDVLIFNASGDGDYPSVDKSSTYSKAIYGSIKKELKYYPSRIEHLEANPVVNIHPVQNTPVITQHNFDNLDTLLIPLKKSNDILSEFVLPLTQRVGYCGKPAPIIPTFFCRYIGVPEGSENYKDDYFNTLYLLDKKLINNKNGYVKIENHLFVPSTNELFDIQDIEVKSDIFNEKYLSLLVYKISQSKRFYKSSYVLLDNTILKALYSMLFLYINNEKCINASKLKNFVYKIVVWLNKYVKGLYKNTDFTETPKVLYYGEIKSHEVYFLMFLSQIGCDVLYVSPNTEYDKTFTNIDVNGQFSYINENSNSIEFESFPVSEKIMRQSTVAFNASQQIDDIIYNADTGLFKPWQFENYFTKQVTLKTTYDELKLLWKEKSKLRPEFKIENSSVYIPNLFAKINGVNENINEYWKSFIELSSAKNCLTITEVPFTKVTYTNQEMYSCAYLLDKNGLIIKENVFNSKFYKFSYLKNSLQQHIFTKINELIMSKCFIRQIDEKLKLKILMTILTLDAKVLYLLETFDFASEIPKLLIYHNKPDQLSIEDAIVIGFLNIIGLDIVIFTPTNYNNIENHFKPDLFDTFQLPVVNLQLEIPDFRHIDFQSGNRRSLFSKIFNK